MLAEESRRWVQHLDLFFSSGRAPWAVYRLTIFTRAQRRDQADPESDFLFVGVAAGCNGMMRADSAASLSLPPAAPQYFRLALDTPSLLTLLSFSVVHHAILSQHLRSSRWDIISPHSRPVRHRCQSYSEPGAVGPKY